MSVNFPKMQQIFLSAVEQHQPEEWDAYLAQACAGDDELNKQVKLLLKAHLEAGSMPSAAGLRQDKTIAYQSPTEIAGAIIGPYKLLQQIGEGGMGTVFMAEQSHPVQRKVALKIVKPGLDSRQVIARFEAERQALALMDHPHIAKVLDAGTTESGVPYFVMELVNGAPVTKYCDERRLSLRERLELFIPVCRAVQHAHQKGIIHRDLKPSNVLIAHYDGRPVPKVIDFGVAKATGSKLTARTMFTEFGAIVGTLEYMSPEQAERNQLDIDTRSDIYSLGVLLYELLTGTTPLDKKRLKDAAILELLRVIKEEEPQKPSTRLSTTEELPSIASKRNLEPKELSGLVRGELDWIVMKALEKDRNRRYATANVFAEDVTNYLTGEPVSAVPPTPGYRLKKFVHKHKAQTAAAAAITALLILTIGMAVWFAWWSELQTAERRHEQELIAARNNDALAATLDRIENALRNQRRTEATTLLRQIDQQPENDWPEDLRARLVRMRIDERTIRELEEIFEERWMVLSTETRMDNERAKQRYPRVFQSYGLKIGSISADDAITNIRRSVISDALATSLVDWFFVDPQYPGLAALLDKLDPEPLRARIRAKIQTGDWERIKALSHEIDGSQLPPSYAIGLRNAGGEAHILKAAWPAHPDSFPLALTICGATCGTDQEEAVGWGRMAIALRPKNALAHYFYALSSFYVGSDDWDDRSGRAVMAIHELRRTIELAPKFARAHGWLAYLLYSYGQPREENASEAISLARKAVELDDFNDLGHITLFVASLKEEKYIEALKEYQRLTTLHDDDKSAIVNEGYAAGLVFGIKMTAKGPLFLGLAQNGWPLEAYRLIEDGDPKSIDGMISVLEDGGCYLQAARVAALAGCGQGTNVPPEAERSKIRTQARAWLIERYDAFKKSSEDPDARAVVHDELTRWLGEPGFSGVRDDQALAKLPLEEQGPWRNFWADVRTLHDKTSHERD